jgi:hypothetical protein
MWDDNVHLLGIPVSSQQRKYVGYLQFLHTVLALVAFPCRDLLLTMGKVSCQRCTFGGAFAFVTDYWVQLTRKGMSGEKGRVV